MTYKVCVYKDCENYVRDGVPSGNKQFTIFRFPKDPARRKEWLMRAEVLNILPESQMWICSEHFDKKYLLANMRRTIPASTALPFPYRERMLNNMQVDENAINIDNSKLFNGGFDNEVDNLDNELVISIHHLNAYSESIRLKNVGGDEGADADGISEYFKENKDSNGEYCVESTTSTTKAPEEVLPPLEEEYTEMSDSDEEILREIAKQSTEKDTTNSQPHAAKKRKMHSEDTYEDEEPSSSKQVATKITTVSEKEKVSSANTITKRTLKPSENVANDTHNPTRQQNTSLQQQQRLQNENPAPQQPEESLQIDAEALLDKSDVTCFIFRGEEYVQMSKEYYLQEKMELLKKLRKYENVLKLFKNNLEALDL